MEPQRCPECGWQPGLIGGLMCSTCLLKFEAMQAEAGIPGFEYVWNEPERREFSPRGGKREGAGRPPLGSLPLVQTSVRLPQDAIDKLRELGGGNVSEGIRRLLQMQRP